jgi:IclR family acetate operon transcriptional repressor
MRSDASHVVQAADHVLTLLEILRRDDELHIHAAARELGVAPSTAHRLVQTLVFRGYAVRRLDHSYGPGPALPRNPSVSSWSSVTSRWHPVLVEVVRRTGETAHVVVRDGTSAIFIDSVVSQQALTVGSRAGTRMAAERNSGGKVLLAQLPLEPLRELYEERSDVDLEALLAKLESIRREGFALSEAESERGIRALGVLASRDDAPPVAITVSGPSLRFDRRRALRALADLREVVATPVSDST